MTYTDAEIENMMNGASKQKQIPQTDSIAKKREELEILRIDTEINRLKKPDIAENSYFKDAMAMQQQHFNQLLEMQKQHMDLKLEIEKMKLIDVDGGDDSGGLEILEVLKPMLPLIAEGMKKKNNPDLTSGKEVPLPSTPLKSVVAALPKKKKEEKLTIQEIREGKITEDEAWIDFQEQVPPVIVKQMGRKGFKKEYDAIKAGLK